MTPPPVGGVRLATRGSRLALAQAELAGAALAAAGVEATELVVIRTQGDRDQQTPVEHMEGQGWFTSDLERALLDDRADCAVHSAKDLPSELAPGLVVAAFLERADCRDGIVGRGAATVEGLAPGSRVGTSSARRVSLLAALRPDVSSVPMRGNVDTRLRKLDDGEVDALLLACAGLDRLGLGDRIGQRLDPSVFVPAPCQGTIAVEAAAGSAHAAASGGAEHHATRAAMVAERAVLVALGGGCLIPLGAWARLEEGRLVLSAALAVEGAVRRAELVGDPDHPARLGEAVAAQLR